MANSFHLQILTPQRMVFSGPAVSLMVPGELGNLGVLANHAPLLTKLIPGKITFKKENEEGLTLQSQGGGFLEVHKNQTL